MKYITTLAATGLGTILLTGITGCTQQTQEQAQAKGAFVIIEETAPGKYQIQIKMEEFKVKYIQRLRLWIQILI